MPDGRLLILDDDPAVGQILLMASRHAGFESRWCDTPEAFFEAAQSWDPTHVAVDLLMPELSGIEVLRGLAARGSTAWVIVSSGVGEGELQAALEEARLMGLRTAGGLPKPFSLASVRALLSAQA